MEKPHDEKENLFNSNPFPNYLLSAPNLQLPSLNMTKKAKSKTKSQKSHTSNLRAGDWVCLICNNLNFSFRNECNRCQVQTKEQNQLQSLYISENPNAQDLLQNRLPFKDLTNDKAQPAANKVSTSNNTASTSHIKSKSTPIQGDLGHIVLQNLLNNEDIHGKFQNHLIQGTSNNKGFENKLLVTPPKHRQNKSLNIFKEYSDSSQKELPPYRSPEHLPSISPIMKNVFGYNYREVGRDGKSRSAFTFLKEDGQPISEIDELESKESSFTDDWRRVDKIRANLASMDHSRVNSGSGTIGSENGWRSTVENSMEGDFFENIKEIRQDKKE